MSEIRAPCSHQCYCRSPDSSVMALGFCRDSGAHWEDGSAGGDLAGCVVFELMSPLRGFNQLVTGLTLTSQTRRMHTHSHMITCTTHSYTHGLLYTLTCSHTLHTYSHTHIPSLPHILPHTYTKTYTYAYTPTCSHIFTYKYKLTYAIVSESIIILSHLCTHAFK